MPLRNIDDLIRTTNLQSRFGFEDIKNFANGGEGLKKLFIDKENGTLKTNVLDGTFQTSVIGKFRSLFRSKRSCTLAGVALLMTLQSQYGTQFANAIANRDYFEGVLSGSKALSARRVKIILQEAALEPLTKRMPPDEREALIKSIKDANLSLNQLDVFMATLSTASLKLDSPDTVKSDIIKHYENIMKNFIEQCRQKDCPVQETKALRTFMKLAITGADRYSNMRSLTKDPVTAEFARQHGADAFSNALTQVRQDKRDYVQNRNSPYHSLALEMAEQYLESVPNANRNYYSGDLHEKLSTYAQELNTYAQNSTDPAHETHKNICMILGTQLESENTRNLIITMFAAKADELQVRLTKLPVDTFMNVLRRIANDPSSFPRGKVTNADLYKEVGKVIDNAIEKSILIRKQQNEDQSIDEDEYSDVEIS